MTILLIKDLVVPARAVDSEEDSSYETVITSFSSFAETEYGNKIGFTFRPDTEIVFPSNLISTPDGTDTGF